MDQPSVQILIDDTQLTPTIDHALQRLGASSQLLCFDTPPLPDQSTEAHARLVLTTSAGSLTNGRLPKLLDWSAQGACATLVLSETPVSPDTLPDGLLDGGMIGFASGLSSDELTGRLSAMCGLHPSLHRLRQETESLKQRELLHRTNLRRMNDQLRVAGSLKRRLQMPVPTLNGGSMHTLYQPADSVGGDVYDVTRLDDTHVAILLADATGHDLSAGLLSEFVKRSFRAGRVRGHASALADPSEILARANRDLLRAQLDECHFVTAIYAIYDESTHMIRWARGGAPYPVLLRPGQPPKQLVSDGCLLGALPEARCEVAELQLQPDDVLVFHTDGLDDLPLAQDGEASHTTFESNPWFPQFEETAIEASLERIEEAVANCRGPRDDVTLLALEVRNASTIEQCETTELLLAAAS